MRSRNLAFLAVAILIVGAAAVWLLEDSPTVQSIKSAAVRQVPGLAEATRQLPEKSIVDRLAEKNFALGQPVLLRVFKEEGELELWLERDGHYELAFTYPICRWSGTLGPKLREGDGQSPEGYYFASQAQLKPDSNYYRAINVGFPNAHDRQLGRTGSYLMIHGDCVSIGCYAMTDGGIDDIYRAVESAMLRGQTSIAIHLYPFRLTEENMNRHQDHASIAFWRNLAEGDRLFAATGKPPAVSACAGRYRFAAEAGGLPKSKGCEPVTAW